MPAPYSIDLREKIVLAYQNNEGSMNKLGKRFKVSVNFISTLIERFKQTGKVDPKPHGGGRRPAIEASGQSFIRNLLKDQPDLTLEEICGEYNKPFEPVTRSTIDRTLNTMKITRKKKTLFDGRKNTPENQEKLLDYKINIAPFKPEELIYIDEMGAVRNITCNYARSEKGQRAKSENSITPGTRVSTVGALGFNGLLTEFCYEGTMTAIVFRFFVEKFLVPILLPSNVVILDNAKVHYDEDAIFMIEATGAGIVFLPPYSPELNPIENIWAKVKNYLRKVTILDTEELYKTIALALETITPNDARNCFLHCL